VRRVRCPARDKQYANKAMPEYVVDETVTLLLVRHSHNAAVDFLDTVGMDRPGALSSRLRLVPQIRGQGVVIHRLCQLRYDARVACS
jgi:hypothetical protein